MFGKSGENIEFCLCKLDLFVTNKDLTAVIINKKIGKVEFPFDRSFGIGRRAKRSTYSCEQLSGAEGLGYIIVCAEIQSRDLVGLTYSCGKDYNGVLEVALTVLINSRPSESGRPRSRITRSGQ